MREQEVRELYEAYMQVHQPKEEVEQLDEEMTTSHPFRTGTAAPPPAPTLPTPASRKPTQPQQKAKIKPVGEEVENWVNSLIDEGYDLSEYTWDEMAEIYIDEAAKRTPKKVRGAKDTKSYQDGRSQAGMMVSGDSQVSGAGYMRRGGGVQTQTDPNQRQPQQGRMDRYTRDEMEYRKARLKKESHDLFDTILEHLVAEGYADTNESALAIMANMSEEWREEILDEAAKDQSDKQIQKGVKTTYKAQGDIINDRSPGINRVSYRDRDDKIKRMKRRLKARRDDLFGERNRREDESREEIKRKYGF
jgi:hypothetical protein